jgi:2-oxoglutarate ferredoxin oxidoreductase subunit delta
MGIKVKGEVFIHKEWCKGCGFCIEFCPPKVLDVSSEFNAKGYHPPYVKSKEKCTGCNLCGMLCPDFCIWSRKLEQANLGTL